MAVIRVLLIEDDPSYARLIERMLALAPIGFNVTVADTLREAQSVLIERRFNLILTVLDLPDEKDLDTVDALRSAESTLPIVVLTGLEDENLEMRAISLPIRTGLVSAVSFTVPVHRPVSMAFFAMIAPDEPVGRFVDEGFVGGESWGTLSTGHGAVYQPHLPTLTPTPP